MASRFIAHARLCMTPSANSFEYDDCAASYLTACLSRPFFRSSMRLLSLPRLVRSICTLDRRIIGEQGSQGSAWVISWVISQQQSGYSPYRPPPSLSRTNAQTDVIEPVIGFLAKCMEACEQSAAGAMRQIALCDIEVRLTIVHAWSVMALQVVDDPLCAVCTPTEPPEGARFCPETRCQATERTGKTH